MKRPSRTFFPRSGRQYVVKNASVVIWNPNGDCGDWGPFGDVEFDELPLELVSLGDVSAILHLLTCNHDALKCNHDALTCNHDAQRKCVNFGYRNVKVQN